MTTIARVNNKGDHPEAKDFDKTVRSLMKDI